MESELNSLADQTPAAARRRPYRWSSAPTSLGARAWRRLTAVWERYVTCRGNKETYLRRQGVVIGEGSQILNDPAEFGSEPWLVEIGNRVTITTGVLFLTHDGASRLFRDRIPNASRFGNGFAPVRVRDNSFVGARAILLPGVTIGPNSIVGAGSVVTRDVPPNTVVAGVPAREICSLEEYVERYQANLIPIESREWGDLRRELTTRFFGHPR